MFSSLSTLFVSCENESVQQDESLDQEVVSKTELGNLDATGKRTLKIHLDSNSLPYVQTAFSAALERLNGTPLGLSFEATTTASAADINIKLEIHKMRMIKDKSEIKNIKKACDITCNIIKNVNKKLYTCSTEMDIKNLIMKINYSLGGYKLAFKSICSSGQSNSILHHEPTNKKIKDNLLILLDIGFKYNNYCSDITRMLSKKKFTKKQLELYKLLKSLQHKIINKLKPNITWDLLNNFCLKEIYNILIKINIFKKGIIYDKELIKNFMPHLIGHSIGLETHDIEVFDYLKKNMVIAIEPGIYFNKKLLKNQSKFLNQMSLRYYINNIGGMRIEDIILILDKPKILSNIF